MKTLVDQLSANFESFVKDAQAQVENGNKAAGARARKISLEIEKLLKQFRKDSIAAGK
ncbi:MAG: histone H1 [Bacteroides sp.]|nr:histone H1 [Bacteroides sp.]